MYPNAVDLVEGAARYLQHLRLIRSYAVSCVHQVFMKQLVRPSEKAVADLVDERRL